MSEIPEDVWKIVADGELDDLAKSYVHGATFDGDTAEEMMAIRRWIARAILAERKRCIGHVYGQAGSDNVAQRTVKAIESGQ